MGSEGKRVGITEKSANAFCKDAKVVLFVSTLIMVQLWACPNRLLNYTINNSVVLKFL